MEGATMQIRFTRACESPRLLRSVVAAGAIAVILVSAAAAADTVLAGAKFEGPLSGQLPYDVDEKKVRSLVASGNVSAAHAEFNILAWRAFIALNWPAEATGDPSKSKTIDQQYDDVTRVWETWRPSDSIFLAGGAPPPRWDGLPQRSSNYSARAAWRQHTTESSNLEAFSGPLVDQHGHWVRYQMRVNHEEFDYIVCNELYSQEGQIRFSHALLADQPCADGSKPSKTQQVELPVNVGTKHGAIEIKLAWKQLEPHEDKARFFTRELEAELSEPPGPDGKKPVEKFTAGLVAMHIAMKTQSSPEWIWSTFEQVDNVRVNADVHGQSIHPSFYEPARKQPVNVLPLPNATVNPATGALEVVSDNTVAPSKWIESLTTVPVQVRRVAVPTQPGLNPYDAELGKVAAGINTQAQRLLHDANSKFQYYELIDTQWPVHPNAPASAGGANSAPESITHKTPGDMVPVFLVNTTMETYFQKGSQTAGALEQDDRLAPQSATIDATMVNGTESCVGCHYSSGITIAFKQDLSGQMLVDQNTHLPCPVYGENNHFGKTGNASFSWMLQLEPKAKPIDAAKAFTKVAQCP
jgi:hypothetical protein